MTLRDYLMNFVGWHTLMRSDRAWFWITIWVVVVAVAAMCDLDYVLGLAKHQRIQRFDYS